MPTIGALGSVRKASTKRHDPWAHALRAFAAQRCVRSVASLSRANLPLAAEIAAIPEKIRGYGHVKLRSLAIAKEHEADLMARWRSGKIEAPAALAAE